MSELGEEIEQSGKDMESRAVDVLALNKENYDELRNLKKQLKKIIDVMSRTMPMVKSLHCGTFRRKFE